MENLERETVEQAPDGSKLRAMMFMLFYGVIFGVVLGVAIGVHYGRKVDARIISNYQVAIERWKETQGMSNEVLGGTIAAANVFKARLDACEAQFSEATILYEQGVLDPRPVVIAGLAISPMTPSNMTPRWFVPARVKPLAIGDVQAMRYEYVDGHGKREGPFVPETPNQVAARNK